MGVGNSILYKTKLPFLIVFNKTDAHPHDFALEWMRDFESFQQALESARSTSDNAGGFMGNLNHSMSLMLDEFYKHLRVRDALLSLSLSLSLSAPPSLTLYGQQQAVGVSALTGDGMSEFFEAVDAARAEYEAEYKPELDRVVDQRKKEREEHKQQQLEKLVKDMRVGGRKEVPVGPARTAAAAADDDRYEDADDDEEEGEFIDRTLSWIRALIRFPFFPRVLTEHLFGCFSLCRHERRTLRNSSSSE
jgi:putative protein kinase ArgK-like GTPase of G3E family